MPATLLGTPMGGAAARGHRAVSPNVVLPRPPLAQGTQPTRAARIIARGEGRSANRARMYERDAAAGATSATVEAGDVAAEHADVADGARVAPAPETAHDAVWGAAHDLMPRFAEVDGLIGRNLRKVQQAFRDQQVGPHLFSGSTGYGHGDLGRERLDAAFAAIFEAEAAMVRIQIQSGTHAIACALFATLRPGGRMLAVAGAPYDTLEEVIGTRGTPGVGSLMDWGVKYDELPLTEGGGIDYDGLASAAANTDVALIQRSCGYALRPTLTIAEIERAVAVVKAANPACAVVVDNCYGEFTEAREPTAVGADLCMGSLIKNPGGTLVTGGGYVAGRKELVEAACARLSAPGLSLDAGSVPGETMRLMYQGLFYAPQMVGEALKGGRLVAEVMARRGLSVVPPPDASPLTHPSIITAVEVGSKEAMVAFCEGVQRAAPVGSYIRPTPGVTPGYADEVIFADGTFIDGSTSELSADGPLRPPFVVYCQGGTHWTHWAYALECALESVDGRGE